MLVLAVLLGLILAARPKAAVLLARLTTIVSVLRIELPVWLILVQVVGLVKMRLQIVIAMVDIMTVMVGRRVVRLWARAIILAVIVIVERVVLLVDMGLVRPIATATVMGRVMPVVGEALVRLLPLAAGNVLLDITVRLGLRQRRRMLVVQISTVRLVAAALQIVRQIPIPTA